MINAGKYRYQITIVSIEKTKDADGFETETEVNVLQPYAEIKTTKGFTLVANGSDFDKAYTRFVIRYPQTTVINRRMFVLFRGKRYSIEYLNDIDERMVELELQCKEVTH